MFTNILHRGRPMDAFPRVFTRKRHNYRKVLSDDMKQRLREALSPQSITRGLIAEIQRQTGIPRACLTRWRALLLQGREPWQTPHRRPHYGLPQQTEDAIYDAIRARIEGHEYCPRALLRSLANQYGRQVNPNFKAGRSWVKGFLRRYGLSLRVAHPRRRTAPNDGVLAAFLQELELATRELPSNLIFNMDETAWRLFNGQLTTIARRGSDEVAPVARLDERSCFTVICTVSLRGDKLTPWVILKGTTKRCEASYRNDPRLRRLLAARKLVITHSDNGWATRRVMRRYLEWLADKARHHWSYLVWDLYASHRHQEVKDTATENSINLAYVPAGQTSLWQPLDVRVFGALKAHANSLLDAECVNRSLTEMNMVDALLILVRAWDDLPSETITSAWASVIGPRLAFPSDEEEEIEEEEEEEEEQMDQGELF